MVRAGAAWSSFAGWLIVACASPPSIEPAVQAEPIQLPSVVESATPSAIPSATASAAPSVSAIAKLPVRASTPGLVQCESTDCDVASEVCCVAPANDGKFVGRCVAKPKGDVTQSPCCDPNNPHFCGNARGITTDRRCDEAADCGSNRCCSFGAGEGDLITESCGDHCLEEMCLAGSTCANGNHCKSDPEALGGQCPLQIKPAKCGATTCASGEACCWDAANGKGRCATDCQKGDAKFACTSPEQCAPYACNAWATLGADSYVCGGEGFIAGVLCRTLKDCPTNISALGYGPSAPRATSCASSKELPPGVKACVYR